MIKEPLECFICFESFIFPKSINENLEIYNYEVINKANEYMIKNNISGKTNKKIIINQFSKRYYQRLWYPHYKQYKCSTENCNTAICGTCIEEINKRSINEIFRCTHCRLYDWKVYMTKCVLPQIIMKYLSKKSLYNININI